jgi:hypothetical protein
MTAIVPSYIAKVARAKEHLIDLQMAVNAYADLHPYTVSKRIEGKKETPRWRLEFTASPANTNIPILAADVIYNLRSSLDHLMSAMVAKKDRGKAMFPIFFEGVWEAIVPGENQERIKQRMRWASDIKTVPDEAVAVLKKLQPADTAGDDPRTFYLRLINGLSNRDRHEKLPVVASGLSSMRAELTIGGGKIIELRGREPDSTLQDQADLHLPVPEQVVDVQVEGLPLVAIPAHVEHQYTEIPLRLIEAAAHIETYIFPRLTPFVRADAA